MNSFMHNLETASRLKAVPTGNGRSMGYSTIPQVRMTNSFISSGDSSLNEMMAEMKNGLLGIGRPEVGIGAFARAAEGPIGYALQQPFSFGLVRAGWVFRFLVLYIVVALPLNWYLFARWKRREWSWLTAALFALLFANYGYRHGIHSQGKEDEELGENLVSGDRIF